MDETGKMTRGLKNRHLQMIALGGAIGTGLFYGSASTIALAGPAVIVSYLLGGIVIYLVMRMMGEMSVAEPVSGSFSYHATKYWGEFPGFLAGWNYWIEYVLVSMAEITAVGIYVQFWLPDMPGYLSALICLIAVTMINLATVRAYGEMEFFMSIIKVAAIISMIVFGLCLLLARPEPFPDNFSNLWANGGFFPNGLKGMALSTAVVMFSFGGIELIGITAGEAVDPGRTIPKAINQVLWRIMIFYIGTMAVLMALWPWHDIGLNASPFVQIFANMGITTAAHILNFVVLTAAISVYNSAVYSNSRMLYGLATSGDAPKFLRRLSSHGVPVNGILLSSGITLIITGLNYFFPEQIFITLLSVVVAAAVISWVVIVITHLKFRAHVERQGMRTSFPAPFYPAANYLCLAFFAAIIAIMYQLDSMQPAVIVLPIWLLILAIGYAAKKAGAWR